MIYQKATPDIVTKNCRVSPSWLAIYTRSRLLISYSRLQLGRPLPGTRYWEAGNTRSFLAGILL